MNADTALREIRGLASVNRFIVSRHAEKQALTRGVTANDMHYALVNANSCTWQEDHKTWKVQGIDLDGGDLTLAVVIQDDVLVVTVF